MNDTNNDGFGIVVRIVDGVTAAECDPQARCKRFARGSDPGLIEQGQEMAVDFVDETVGLRGRVLGEEGPDVDEVVQGGFGYSEASRRDFRLPAALISSASKSRTRPAALS